MKHAGIKGKLLFNSNEYVFDWEKNYLSKPTLKDLNELPDLEKSKVWYLNGHDRPVMQEKVICKKHENVSFRVDLVNKYGVQRSLGGDEVRVWIEEDPSTGSGKRFSASGLVKDYGNGSYAVTATPVWTGLTNVSRSIVSY